MNSSHARVDVQTRREHQCQPDLVDEEKGNGDQEIFDWKICIF